MKIRKEFDSLKASIHDLNKKIRRNRKVTNFISKKYDTVVLTIKDLKEHHEGVESQIQQIEEDISSLDNDGYKSSWMNLSSTRKGTVSK